MGALQERITADMKAALKAGDKPRLSVLRMLIAAIKDEQIRVNQDSLPDAAEVAILRKAVLTRRDTIEQAKAGGRADVVAAETREIAVIESYLPARLTGDALQAKVAEVAAAIGYAGPKDTGRFMKEWMVRHKDLADGRDVQEALRRL
jgi:uncharacterized protein YqeY